MHGVSQQRASPGEGREGKDAGPCHFPKTITVDIYSILCCCFSVADLSGLTYLNLNGCRQLTDVGCKSIKCKSKETTGSISNKRRRLS